MPRIVFFHSGNEAMKKAVVAPPTSAKINRYVTGTESRQLNLETMREWMIQTCACEYLQQRWYFVISIVSRRKYILNVEV